MYLMYYIDDEGNRVYTMEVIVLIDILQTPLYYDPELEVESIMIADKPILVCRNMLRMDHPHNQHILRGFRLTTNFRENAWSARRDSSFCPRSSSH